MSIYTGLKVALLTQHGKELVIAPVLEPSLGCVIEHVTGFDTDQLGTFTRDIPRHGNQVEAARRKARMGMALSGLKLGLASEGSVGPDPYLRMMPWNVELLIFIDDQRGIEIVGQAQGAGRYGHLQTQDWPSVESFVQKEGFPSHQMVLRPQDQHDQRIHKGIADWITLKSCFDDCLAKADNGQVFVETDMRAFANPSRMQHIEQAAHDLVQRMQSRCPACDLPGYRVTERQPGLPCSTCGLPTSIYLSEKWQCVGCVHASIQVRTDRRFAEPQYCAYCNP